MTALPTAPDVTTAAARLGRSLTRDQATRLAAYLGLLVKWNQKMNLVGPSSWPDMLETLIQDSWHLADLLESLAMQPGLTLDLGAGAGLPGIPLRVFWSPGEYILVEPRQKRSLFMEQAVLTLGLNHIRVVCARMEALPHNLRQADLLVSRAFRPWKDLLASAREYLAPEGRVVIMGNDGPDETVAGYGLETVRSYQVAGKTRFFRLFVRRP